MNPFMKYNGNPMCCIIGDGLQDDLGNNFHIDIDDKRSDAKLRWQNVTGEFARCSGFTYKPYHVIINEAVDGYLRQFSDGNHEMDRLSIPILGDYGRSKTIGRWRRYAKRSQIIHNRLAKEGAFGYIDKGNIQYGDEIGFLITQTDDKELIIYLTHNGNVFGDLNHPKYGSKRDSSLKRIYQEFREELNSSGTIECQSKHTTHVSSVFAGFPRFIENKNAVNPNSWPLIADYKSDSEDIRFWNGTSGFTEYVWHDHYLRPQGRMGKPFVLLPAPKHYIVSEERRTVPLYISAIEENGIEWKVIKAAFKCKCRDNRFDIDYFFKCFFNCYDAVTLGCQDGTLELQDGRISISCNNARIIKVITRDVDSYSGKSICSIIKYDEKSDLLYITNSQCLRTKISYKCKYNEVAKYDSNLPQDYDDFLKQVCHIPLIDLCLHNSWISLNKLQFLNDGTVEEINDYSNIGHNHLNIDKWRESVIVHDSITHEAYRIWIEDIEQTPWVYRVDFRKEEKPFVELKCVSDIKTHLLQIMAYAVVKRGRLPYYGRHNSQLRFGYDGIVYEFSLYGIDYNVATYADGYRGEDENGEVIWDIEYSYAQNSILPQGISIKDIKPIQSEITNSNRFYQELLSHLSIIARHYNGLNESWNAITSKWFDASMLQHHGLNDSLKKVLVDIQNRKADLNLNPDIAIQLKKCIKDYRNHKRSKWADALMDHLIISGIKIYTDVTIGQKILNEKQQNYRFFISRDGKIVYGFVDKATETMYLDPDIMTLETIIHEYTHLWSNKLRQIKPEIWERLVCDLKEKEGKLWYRVAKTYGSFYNKELDAYDDVVAEEVFSHKAGRKWADKLSQIDISSQHGLLEITVNRDLEYRDGMVISAEDRINYLLDTVAIDMLSIKHFLHFEIIEDWLEYQINENQATAAKKEPNTVTVTIDSISDNMPWKIAIHRLNHIDDVVIDGDNVTIPNNEETKEELRDEGFIINFMMDLDEEKKTITVRSNNRNYLNQLISDFDKNDNQGLSFHINLDEDEESYLPEVFKTKRQDEKDEIDFSEYKQLTIELYEKLNSLGPCSHYINTSKNGDIRLVFLGKEEQSLYIPQIAYKTEFGRINSEEISIGNPIRSSNGKQFYVVPCDRNESSVEYLSKAIGYFDDMPISTNPNADCLIDFSKTPVLTHDLYRDLLSLGRQMRLTKYQQSKKGDFYKITIFYGQGNMTLTLSENSRIGYLINSKNGINYHTKECDLDNHSVDDVSRSIEYEGHTPVPRIIKSEFIDFSKHRVLNKTLYARLLKQGKHMRITKENENGKYVVFYGADFINLYVTEQTKIGALIKPIYKNHTVIGYRAQSYGDNTQT